MAAPRRRAPPSAPLAPATGPRSWRPFVHVGSISGIGIVVVVVVVGGVVGWQHLENIRDGDVHVCRRRRRHVSVQYMTTPTPTPKHNTRKKIGDEWNQPEAAEHHASTDSAEHRHKTQDKYR